MVKMANPDELDSLLQRAQQTPVPPLRLLAFGLALDFATLTARLCAYVAAAGVAFWLTLRIWKGVLG